MLERKACVSIYNSVGADGGKCVCVCVFLSGGLVTSLKAATDTNVLFVFCCFTARPPLTKHRRWLLHCSDSCHQS